MASPLLWQQFKTFVTRYPIARGMISYSLIWPTGSLIQQTFEGKNWGKSQCAHLVLDKIVIVAIAGNYDWWRVLRFSMYGGLFVAPTLYGWVKVFSEYSLQSTIFKSIP